MKSKKETTMPAILSELELILKGEQINTEAGTLLIILFVTLGISGSILGFRKDWRQIFAGMIKLPVIFISTTLICIPVFVMLSIYLNLDIGVIGVVRMILIVQCFHGIFIMSFSPMIIFFALGSGYDFMKLFITGIYATGGLLSILRLLQDLWQLTQGNETILIFVCWVALYGFVGCQMAWLCRPLIGSPKEKFELFRRKHKSLNFWQALYQSLEKLSSSDRDVGEKSDSSLPGNEKRS